MYAARWKRLRDGYPFRDLKQTIAGFHAAGDLVVMEASATGYLRDGAPYQCEGCVAYELSQGKIVRVRHYADTKKTGVVAAMLARATPV